MLLCPYCRQGVADSDEHIFPSFLGGTATVRACVQCNSTLGHAFEGPVHKMVTPLQVILGCNGIEPNKQVVWKDAGLDHETGLRYDLRSDLRAALRGVKEIRSDGRTVVHGSERIVLQYVKKFGDREHRITPIERSVESSPDPLSISLGREVVVVAAKVAISLCRYFRVDDEVVDSSFLYRVREGLDELHRIYPVWPPHLTSNKLPMVHIAYVEAKSCGQVVACVSFFELFSVYLLLSESYEGTGVALCGRLDAMNGDERIAECASVNLMFPARDASVRAYSALRAISAMRFDSKVRQRAGELSYSISPSSLDLLRMLSNAGAVYPARV